MTRNMYLKSHFESLAQVKRTSHNFPYQQQLFEIFYGGKDAKPTSSAHKTIFDLDFRGRRSSLCSSSSSSFPARPLVRRVRGRYRNFLSLFFSLHLPKRLFFFSWRAPFGVTKAIIITTPFLLLPPSLAFGKKATPAKVRDPRASNQHVIIGPKDA